MTALHVALSCVALAYLVFRLTLVLWCKPRLFRCSTCGGTVKAHKLSGIDVPVCVDCGETYLIVEPAR